MSENEDQVGEVENKASDAVADTAEPKFNDVKLGEQTVTFLEPGTLLRMLIGFNRAEAGSDYELATREYRELCHIEVLRRMHVEYLSRGSRQLG